MAEIITDRDGKELSGNFLEVLLNNNISLSQVSEDPEGIKGIFQTVIYYDNDYDNEKGKFYFEEQDNGKVILAYEWGTEDGIHYTEIDKGNKRLTYIQKFLEKGEKKYALVMAHPCDSLREEEVRIRETTSPERGSRQMFENHTHTKVGENK